MADAEDLVMAEKADEDAEAQTDAEEAMATFIAAVKAGDAKSAHSAMEAYKVFCDAESGAAEEGLDEETFSG